MQQQPVYVMASNPQQPMVYVHQPQIIPQFQAEKS